MYYTNDEIQKITDDKTFMRSKTIISYKQDLKDIILITKSTPNITSSNIKSTIISHNHETLIPPFRMVKNFVLETSDEQGCSKIPR